MEFVLLILSLVVVCLAFVYTTKLYYDRQAHVDVFDQILLLITTIGDFAYSLFGLFASIFITEYTIKVPRAVEILIGLFALCETFLQTSFILDALRRRTITKSEVRQKPGRELITALLLINLGKYKSSLEFFRCTFLFSDMVARFTISEKGAIESCTNALLRCWYMVNNSSIYITIINILSISFKCMFSGHLARSLSG
jgi:hypothetical protein